MNTKAFLGILFSLTVVACGPITEKGDGPDQATPTQEDGPILVELSTDSEHGVFATMAKDKDMIVATFAKTNSLVIDHRQGLVLTPGLLDGDYLVVRLSGLQEGEEIFTNCELSRNISFFLTLGNEKVLANRCVEIGDVSYIVAQRQEKSLILMGELITYASGPTPPPPSCEERGDCPPPSCEERGDCPSTPPSTEGCNVEIKSKGIRFRVRFRTEFSEGTMFASAINTLYAANYDSALPNKGWPTTEQGVSDVTCKVPNPIPVHEAGVNNWETSVLRNTWYEMTDEFPVLVNIRFTVDDWFADWYGLQTNRGKVLVDLRSLDGTVNKTYAISTLAHIEHNGQKGTNMAVGVRAVDVNENGVPEDLFPTHWDAVSRSMQPAN